MRISSFLESPPISILSIRTKIKELLTASSESDAKGLNSFLTSLTTKDAESSLKQDEWKKFQKLIEENRKDRLLQLLDQELYIDYVCSFDKVNVEINKKKLYSLFSDDSFIYEATMITRIINNLLAQNLLTADTLKKALTKADIKPFTLPETTVEKISRKSSKKNRSQLIIGSGDKKETLFLEHKERKASDRTYNLSRYPRGTFGIVKMLYPTENGETPTHVLKKTISTQYQDDVAQFYQEAAINHLVDDQVKIFKRQMVDEDDGELIEEYKPFMIQKYISGKNLTEFKREDFKEVKYSQRLAWLEGPLETLVKLHNLSYVFLDIKFSNMKLDIEKNQLRLLDFGCARPFFKNFRRIGTALFKPDHLEKVIIPYTIDMYAIGLIAANFFPELYDFTNYKATQIKKTGLSHEEKGIVELINALLEPVHTLRCSAEDALNFIKGFKACYQKKSGEFSSETLQDLLKKTINRSEITERDAFQDSLRASLFPN